MTKPFLWFCRLWCSLRWQPGRRAVLFCTSSAVAAGYAARVWHDQFHQWPAGVIRFNQPEQYSALPSRGSGPCRKGSAARPLHERRHGPDPLQPAEQYSAPAQPCSGPCRKVRRHDNCTSGGMGLIRCNQPEQYSAPAQPWQRAMRKGSRTTNCTSGGMGLIRCNQPEQYSAPASRGSGPCRKVRRHDQPHERRHGPDPLQPARTVTPPLPSRGDRPKCRHPLRIRPRLIPSQHRIVRCQAHLTAATALRRLGEKSCTLTARGRSCIPSSRAAYRRCFLPAASTGRAFRAPHTTPSKMTCKSALTFGAIFLTAVGPGAWASAESSAQAAMLACDGNFTTFGAMQLAESQRR